VGSVAQSVQRLATGWTVLGSNPGGREIFRTRPDRPSGPPSLLYNGYRVFPCVKSGRDVTLTPYPLLVPWSRQSKTIPLLPPMGRTACTESKCLYKGALYLFTNTGLFKMIVGVLTTCHFGTNLIIMLMFVESQMVTYRVPVRYVTKTWSVVLINKKIHILLSQVYCV